MQASEHRNCPKSLRLSFLFSVYFYLSVCPSFCAVSRPETNDVYMSARRAPHLPCSRVECLPPGLTIVTKGLPRSVSIATSLSSPIQAVPPLTGTKCCEDSNELAINDWRFFFFFFALFHQVDCVYNKRPPNSPVPLCWFLYFSLV